MNFLNSDTEKIIKQDMGVTVTEDKDSGISFYIEEMCIYDHLPKYMKPMVLKAFDNLVEVRKKEQDEVSETDK